MLKKVLICIIFYLILLQTASAIGVGVTPGSLNFSDEDYADWFYISPADFNLSANENKEVMLELKPPLSAKGEFDFRAYAVSSSPSSDFSVGSGIKVPVHATVSNSGIKMSMVLVLVVIGAGGFYYRKSRKNREDIS
jgi:hypothetical protein